MKIVLFGVPGAGKGTQAELISKKYNIPVISTGNLIREALKRDCKICSKVKACMASGNLVSDDIVEELIKERVMEQDCIDGLILDGFPRNILQAEALDKMNIIIDLVVDIEVDDDIIIKRLSGRRICKDCGASYHLLFKKPINEEICDICSGTLIQREDDTDKTIKHRLKVYHNKTEPVKDYYRKRNKLFKVDGSLKIEDISSMILDELEKR